MSSFPVSGDDEVETGAVDGTEPQVLVNLRHVAKLAGADHLDRDAAFKLVEHEGHQEVEAAAVVVSAGQVKHLATIFERTWQRPPTGEELRNLVESWVREEIYFREGIAMRLDVDAVRVRVRAYYSNALDAGDRAHDVIGQRRFQPLGCAAGDREWQYRDTINAFVRWHRGIAP